MTVTPQVLMGGRYRAIGRLAIGGMGEVWRGEDTLLERLVAMKMLRADYASDPGFRERFRAEARHAAVLTQPNVTQVFDFVEEDGTDSPPCIVMEYVAGESLAAILDREAPLDAERTWSVLGQTAAALAAAHRVGVVHRDIKPGNILVCPSGLVKVTDFGIARALGEASVTNPGLVLGTAPYLAPEQIAGEKATSACDMYALGVVGYRCLTGRLPFEGNTPAAVHEHQIATLPSLPPNVPPGLADIVLALLAKDPADRPSDPDAIATQAQRMVGRNAGSVVHEHEAAVDVTRVLATKRTGRRVPSAHATALALGVVVALVVAATLLATRMLTTGPSASHATGSAAAGGSASAAKPIAVSATSLVGGADHPEELPYVTDSKSSTAWYTEHYASAAFGGLRSGVGLRLQASSAAAVRMVVIHFADPGIAAKLYAGTDASSVTHDKVLAATSSAPAEWRIALRAPVKAQSWLVWITHLVPDSGGYRAGVADVRFLT